MQVVSLELDGFNFYCPVTGIRILGEGAHQTSPAVAFTYIDEVGELQDLSPELQEIRDRVVQESGPDDSAWDRYQKFVALISDDSIVCFEITVCGMACGPVSSTVRIAINMNYSAATE